MTEPWRSYLICATPRSGSTLLAQLLASTELAGTPIEYFHPDRMPELRAEWGADSLDDYMRELVERRSGANGVFGAKLHWGHYERAIAPRDPRTLAPNLRLIRIRREDRLRQAVSWVRALQTLRWSSRSKHVRDVDEVYDRDAIAQKLGRLAREEASWDALFERHGIVAHSLTYEHLVEAPVRVVTEALGFLGIEVPAGLRLPPPPYERLADKTTDAWVARYLAESPRGDRPGLTSRSRPSGSPGSP